MLAFGLVALSGFRVFAADDENDFVRFVDGEDSARLETAVVSYRNADGVGVDLIGVIHIGDGTYYDALNESFKGYDALLYEMVGGGSKEDEADKKEDLAKSGNPLAFFQALMRSMLELEFQLDKIDYKAKNFVHADMDWKTFQKLREEKNENLFGLLDKAVQREDQRPGGGFDFTRYFEAINKAESPLEAKMELARQFDQIELMSESMDGEDGSVILAERNKVALNVLKREIEKGGRKLGLFYGAAHLVGMSEMLREEMGFKYTGTKWLKAWDIPKAQKKRAYRRAK